MHKEQTMNQVSYFHQNVKSKDPKAVYYLLTFLTDFAMSLIFVTYVLFLLSKGLDLFQVNLVSLAFMLGSFVFEIPTGAYADYFGRKKSIVFSSVLMIISFSIYFFSSKFIFFIIAELFSAVATTFASGALDAWIVDKLDQQKYAGRVDFVFSQANIVSRFAALIGGLIGAYIGAINLALPFGIAGIVSVVALIVGILFVESDHSVQNSTQPSKTSNMLKIAKDSIDYGMKHPVVLWLILSSVVTMFAFMPLNIFWTPRLNDLAGNQVWLLGWVWAAMSLFMMFGGYAVSFFLRKNKSYTAILVLMTALLSLPILLISYSNVFAFVLAGFMIHEFGRGMQKPLQKAYLNKHIPSEKRATILSFDSAMGKLGAAIGLVFLGWIGKSYSIQLSWLIAGLVCLVSIFFFLEAGKNEAKSYLALVK